MVESSDESKASIYLAGLSSAVRIAGVSPHLFFGKLGEDVGFELRAALFDVVKMGYPTNRVERLGAVTAALLRAEGVELGKGEVSQAVVAAAVRKAAQSLLP